MSEFTEFSPVPRTFLGRREQTGETSLGIPVQTEFFFFSPALFVCCPEDQGKKVKGSSPLAFQLGSEERNEALFPRG